MFLHFLKIRLKYVDYKHNITDTIIKRIPKDKAVAWKGLGQDTCILVFDLSNRDTYYFCISAFLKGIELDKYNKYVQIQFIICDIKILLKNKLDNVPPDALAELLNYYITLGGRFCKNHIKHKYYFRRSVPKNIYKNI